MKNVGKGFHEFDHVTMEPTAPSPETVQRLNQIEIRNLKAENIKLREQVDILIQALGMTSSVIELKEAFDGSQVKQQ